MEVRLFEEGNPPAWTTPEWYADREAAPHLEQWDHGDRLRLTAQLVQQALDEGATSIVDAGAGDGGLLSLFNDHPSVVETYGFDLQQSNVDAAKIRGVDVALLDVVEENWWVEEILPQTVIIMSEMLEHLVDPHDFLAHVHEYSTAEWLIASSPFDEHAGKHYEFHTWAWDVDGYKALLENNGWAVIRTEFAPITQSQIHLARRK